VFFGRLKERAKLIQAVLQEPRRSSAQQREGHAAVPEMHPAAFVEDSLMAVERDLWDGLSDELIDSIVEDYKKNMSENLFAPGKAQVAFGLFATGELNLNYGRIVQFYQEQGAIDAERSRLDNSIINWGCRICQKIIDDNRLSVLMRDLSNTAVFNHMAEALGTVMDIYDANFAQSFGDFSTGPAYVVFLEGSRYMRKVLHINSSAHHESITFSGCCFYLPPEWQNMDFETPLKLSHLDPVVVQSLVHSAIPRCDECLVPLADLVELMAVMTAKAVQQLDLEGKALRHWLNDYIDSKRAECREVLKTYGPQLHTEQRSKLRCNLTLSDKNPQISISDIPKHLQGLFVNLSVSFPDRPLFAEQAYTKLGLKAGLTINRGERAYAARCPVSLKTPKKTYNLLQKQMGPKLPYYSSSSLTIFPHDWKLSVRVIPQMIYDLKTLTTSRSYKDIDYACLIENKQFGAELVKKVRQRFSDRLHKIRHNLLSDPGIHQEIKSFLMRPEKDPETGEERPLIDYYVPTILHGPQGAKAIFLQLEKYYCGENLPPLLRAHRPDREPYITLLHPRYALAVIQMPKREPRLTIYGRRKSALGANTYQLLRSLGLLHIPVETFEAKQETSTWQKQIKEAWQKFWRMGKPLQEAKVWLGRAHNE